MVRSSNARLDVLPGRAPPPPRCLRAPPWQPRDIPAECPLSPMCRVGKGRKEQVLRPGPAEERKTQTIWAKKRSSIFWRRVLWSGGPQLPSFGDADSHSLLLQQEQGRRHQGDRRVEVSEAVPLASQQFLTWATLRLPSLQKVPFPHAGPPKASLYQGREPIHQASHFWRTALAHQQGLPCPSVRPRAPCNSCGLLPVSPSLGGTGSWVSRSHGTQASAHSGCSIAPLESGLSDGSCPADSTTSSTTVSPPYTEVRDLAQATGMQARPWEQPHGSLLPLWGPSGAQARRRTSALQTRPTPHSAEGKPADGSSIPSRRPEDPPKSPCWPRAVSPWVGRRAVCLESSSCQKALN